MTTFNRFNSFTEAVAEKVHNLGADTLEIALCAAANAPVASNTQLSNLTQISYTNAGVRTLTVSSSSQTSGTYKLVIADKSITASGGAIATFRYVVIFNQTATNDELIGWYDHGGDVNITDGNSYDINFDGTGGVLTIG